MWVESYKNNNSPNSIEQIKGTKVGPIGHLCGGMHVGHNLSMEKQVIYLRFGAYANHYFEEYIFIIDTFCLFLVISNTLFIFFHNVVCHVLDIPCGLFHCLSSSNINVLV